MSEEVRSTLEMRGSAWFEAAHARRSWRTFDAGHIAEDDLAVLSVLAEDFRPYDDARCVVIADASADLFRGIVGSYGGVTGSPHALLVLARDTARGQQHAGYTGQALVLDAVARGIDTCWIGGAFDRDKVAALAQVAEDERPVAVSPLGFHHEPESVTDQLMHSLPRSGARKQIAQIAPGLDESWPAWARVAVECARRAPSAMNRQPWLFALKGDELVLSVVAGREKPELTRALDCGIAMLHAELGARQTGEAAEWTEDVADGELARLRLIDADTDGEAL